MQAQVDTITSCEQQEKILNLEECRFHTYAPPGALPDLCNPSAGCLWCAKKEEELLDFNLPPGGTHPFATRPISYTVEVDWDTCFEKIDLSSRKQWDDTSQEEIRPEPKEQPSLSSQKKETAREWFDRTFGPLLGKQESEIKQEEKEEPGGWQLPGKEFGEFIRKIQSVRLNPFNKPQDEEIIEPVQEQVSNADQETSGQAINDWIMENIGVSDFSNVYKTERPPILKTQEGTDESLKLTFEIVSPPPGSKIDTSGNGVLITKPDSSTLWFKEF